MNPYTPADLEHDFRASLDRGYPDEIARLAHEVDQATQPTAPVSLHSAALWYAEQGLRVFPLQPGTKIPFKGSRGCKDATTDADYISSWWVMNPDSNIGLATGGLVDIVDIDGATGQKSRVAEDGPAWDELGALTVLGTVLTPRDGGMHLYVPASGRGNKAGIFPGIDYRGKGGYVVAPPSVTSVGAYRWLRPLDVARLAVTA